MTQQDSDKILFTVWLINALSRAWGVGASSVYRALRQGNMVDGYILRHYDVLHTMGEVALVDEMTELARKRGVLIRGSITELRVSLSVPWSIVRATSGVL